MIFQLLHIKADSGTPSDCSGDALRLWVLEALLLLLLLREGGFGFVDWPLRPAALAAARSEPLTAAEFVATALRLLDAGSAAGTEASALRLAPSLRCRCTLVVVFPPLFVNEIAVKARAVQLSGSTKLVDARNPEHELLLLPTCCLKACRRGRHGQLLPHDPGRFLRQPCACPAAGCCCCGGAEGCGFATCLRAGGQLQPSRCAADSCRIPWQGSCHCHPFCHLRGGHGGRSRPPCCRCRLWRHDASLRICHLPQQAHAGRRWRR